MYACMYACMYAYRYVCTCATSDYSISARDVFLIFECKTRALTGVDGVATIDTKCHADDCDEQTHGQRLHTIVELVVVVPNGKNAQQ